MKRFFLLPLVAVLCVGAAPVRWANVVTTTPAGAYVHGNPKAKIRLVEYISYTCSHCAQFTTEAGPLLSAGYVAKGLVAVELRNAVRDQIDFALALSARCGGAPKFLGNTALLMKNQAVMMGKLPAFAKANGEKLKGASINTTLKALVRGLGIDMVLKPRGITPAQLDACVTSKATQTSVAAMANEAFSVRKLNATPTFMINDVIVDDVYNWTSLEPKIKAALETN